jgi:hypothetical protein
MNLITDHGKFSELKVVFVANVKQAWDHATVLSLSAVDHYINCKDPKFDTTWITELYEAFCDAGPAFADAFEKMLQGTTNVKLRKDESNLSAPVKAVTKGNLPEGYRDVIQNVEKEGLRRYERKARTKSRAATLNNDWAKKERTVRSPDADGINLQTTEFGKSLVDTAKQADNLTDEQKKVAQKLADDFKAKMAALAAGEDVLTASDIDKGNLPGSGHYLGDPDLDAKMSETLATLTAIMGYEIQNKRGRNGKQAVLGLLDGLSADAHDSLAAFEKAVRVAAEAAQANAA